MRVAMLSQVFAGDGAPERLREALRSTAGLGADLVVLPELPCDEWVPSSRDATAGDAEQPGGPRHQLLATAAREARITLLGGAIVVDPDTGIRHNTALLFDEGGHLVHKYRKVHVPQEPGFFEQDHYEPGDEPPSPVGSLGMSIGLQICSDLNRPEGCHMLAALGAEVILAPRATEAATFDRWELVIRANAMTSCCYVLSVNRPTPERGVAFGGPSIAVAPDGEVILRSEESLAVVDLQSDRVEQARDQYPGYLATPASLYARGWRRAESPPP